MDEANNNVNENVQGNAQTNTTTNAPEIDYGKIEQMINKGAQQKESAILKSYFEQQGMTEDEVKSAVSSYKSERARKAEEEKNSFDVMKQENEALKAQILRSNIDSKATTVALDMGVAKNSVPYVIKMADMSKVIDEKGEIAEDLLKNAIEQVLKDVPQLKASATENSGFVTVGADGNNNETTSNDELKKLFGVKTAK